MSSVHVAWPEVVHDARRPSGGNVYDLELAAALEAAGGTVHEHLARAPDDVGETLATVPDGASVVVDGLLGLAAPDALERESGRLDVLLLVHLPLALAHPGDPEVAARESRALTAAAAVVTTSGWSRRWLLSRYAVSPGRVAVAVPGVVPADPAVPDPGGSRLLCVGPLTRGKGQDVLLEALARLRRGGWSGRMVGSADIDPPFAAALRRRVEREGLPIFLDGPLPRPQMHAAYAEADLLVVPSRLETYGMVVTEAVARGVPVLATDTGGLTEALGPDPSTRPGVLVPPEDPGALASALTRWLADSEHRRRLRDRARVAAAGLPRWSQTAADVLSALPVNRTRPVSVVKA